MQILHSQIVGQGQPLLILHGFLGMSDNWRTLGLKYAEQGFQVHLIDQRNHGHSFHSDDFNYTLLVGDLKKYAQYHQLEFFHLMGHSMGGKTAMLFATEYPQMVKSLVVVDIAPKYYPMHHQHILQGLASIDFDSIASRNEADGQLAKFVPEAAVRQFLLKNLYWQTRERLAFRFNLEALTENEGEIGEALATNKVFSGSTLFLRGEYSEYVLQDDEALIKVHFPKAIIDTVTRAGHWVNAQNPTDFFSKTIQFMQENTQ
ncbi:alpha/beta fold hydrolase [Capnocytophaga canimorsus]|uniref:alpha/beta fold hydrolase n=1 Tax=Capnocytophaga canimorsus TaxID=28188 RepID=UPI0037D79D23